MLHEVYMNEKTSDKNGLVLQHDINALNKKFSLSFQSVTWFSYRDNLEQPLIDSKIKSDKGWGCMLRTGQMILMQAIKRHVLGESF